MEALVRSSKSSNGSCTPKPKNRFHKRLAMAMANLGFFLWVSHSAKFSLNLLGSFTLTSPTKFLELDLGVQDVVEILDVRDSSNAKYYEVNYLAQDRILKELSYEN